MSKENQVQELISGYANGFITDRECNEMCDLILNEITIIREDIEVECSAELDNEWANESIQQNAWRSEILFVYLQGK